MKVPVVLLVGAVLGCTPSAKLPARPALAPDSVALFPAEEFEEGIDAGTQSPNGASGWWVNEEPEHRVMLSTFRLEKNEVTVAQYAEFLRWAGGLGHYSSLMPIAVGPTQDDFAPKPGMADRPMNDVTWYDARAYCLWMGGDLPTEAQWEYAAKGASGRQYPWGSAAPDCQHAVFYPGGETLCSPAPEPVDSHPKGDTPEGLHDMAGNVADWVLDHYGWYPGTDGGTVPVEQDPSGPDGGTLRVVRGGGYRDVERSLRTTNRWGADPALRSDGVGFRCAYSG